MKKSGEIQIAARYASALFELAKASSAIVDIERNLQDLLKNIPSYGLKAAINNPLLTRVQQAEIITALSERLKIHPVAGSFLKVLAKQRRLALLAEIIKQFSALAASARGEISAQLITAAEISAAELKSIAEKIGKTLGKTVILSDKCDTALLGGAALIIGGTRIDASLAGKLSRIEQKLKAA